MKGGRDQLMVYDGGDKDLVSSQGGKYASVKVGMGRKSMGREDRKIKEKWEAGKEQLDVQLFKKVFSEF